MDYNFRGGITLVGTRNNEPEFVAEPHHKDHMIEIYKCALQNACKQILGDSATAIKIEDLVQTHLHCATLEYQLNQLESMHGYPEGNEKWMNLMKA